MNVKAVTKLLKSYANYQGQRAVTLVNLPEILLYSHSTTDDICHRNDSSARTHVPLKPWLHTASPSIWPRGGNVLCNLGLSRPWLFLLQFR